MTYTWTVDLTIPQHRDRNDIIGMVVGSDEPHSVDLNDKPLDVSDHDVLCALAEYLDLPKPYETEPVCKPWRGEFTVDSADDMDDAAVRILVENMRAGNSTR